jgi:hypothetical protein
MGTLTSILKGAVEEVPATLKQAVKKQEVVEPVETPIEQPQVDLQPTEPVLEVKPPEQLGQQEIIAPKPEPEVIEQQTQIDFGSEDSIKKLIDAKGITEAEIQLRAELKRKRENLERRKSAHKKNLHLIDTHPDGAKAGLVSTVTNDSYGKASNSNVEYKQKALQGMTEMFLPKAKQELSTTHLGLARDKDLGRAVAKAIIDGDVSNPRAVKLGQEITKALDFMKERFNSLVEILEH